MPEDLNQQSAPPRPPQQPVSMHEQPRTGHGALPFITAMLGVFLVLESVALGYVVTKYVGVEEAEEEVEQEIQQQVQEQQEEDQEVAQQAPGMQAQGFWSHLTFDTTRELADVGPTTYLRDLTTEKWQANEDDCQGVYSLVDESQRSGMGVGPAGVYDNDVIALFNQVNVTGGSNLSQVLERLDLSLLSVCSNDTDDYVIMLDSSGSTATVGRYEKNTSYWQLYQPVRGVMDGVVDLTFDVFADGGPMLSTGYGDAGHSGWSYWTLTDSFATELVEGCKTSSIYMQDGVLQEEGSRKLECSVEYLK